jgi:hypothetical protein
MVRLRREVKKLNTEVFLKLIKIFEAKSWIIEDDESNQLSLFNRFSSTLSELTDEQQLLLLELTDRFTRIQFDEYLSHINIMLSKLVDGNKLDLGGIENVFIAPLISPDDFGKSKSSTAVQYMFRAIMNYNPHFAGKRFIYTEGLEISGEQVNSEESILFVVDDFVGTGDTAMSALNYLIYEKGVNKEQIVILTIASLNTGYKLINEFDILIYTSLLLNKGISDFYSPDEAQKKLDMMRSIEKKIKVHKNESLGFKESEALLTLIRTPNNTFPVFWKEKKGRIAPFPRN